MNTNLNLHTESSLAEMSTKEIAAIYNEFATELNVKLVARFANKTTCIARTLTLQCEYIQAVSVVEAKEQKRQAKLSTSRTVALATTKVKETKRITKRATKEQIDHLFGKDKVKRQTRFDMEQVISFTDDCKPTEGTIEFSLKQAIIGNEDGSQEDWCVTVGEVVNHVIAYHKRPRSGLGVDEQYVVHNIKWFIKKGHLKLVQA